jgi:chorismate lyase / 3-hydroxybenzoate synthase
VRLRAEYPHLDDLRQRPPEWWHDVLALIHFNAADDARLPVFSDPDIPVVQVSAPLLGASAGRAEIWRLPGPLHSGRSGRVQYRHSDRLLFASVSLPADGVQALRNATRTAYGELFSTFDRLGFPHPLRIWNYLPAINEETGSGERYWHFNGARQDVFMGCNRGIAGNVPAATAVGAAPASALTIYCIAGAVAPISLENPRQLSAWDYPAQYGPRSPTFARACFDNDSAQTLFISGTASIVGHESAHEGDPGEQTRETLRNLSAVVDAANERAGEAHFSLAALAYKVYVRRIEDQPLIEQELRRRLGERAAVIYLRADICRRDLLLEIEAVGTRAAVEPALT